MKYTSLTLQQFVVAFIAMVCALGTLAYLYQQIRQQGAALKTHATTLSDHRRKEESYLRIERQVADTNTERELLKTAFFKDESDSASLLSTIESIAQQANISFSVLSLTSSPVPDSKLSQITFQLRYVGAKDAVLDFSRLLEVLPYMSRLDQLQLSQQQNDWEAQVTLVVLLSSL